MGRYIPNSTENGIATGVQMNAQNISAMRDLQNTKARAESENRDLLMRRTMQLEDQVTDPESTKGMTNDEKARWLKQKQEEIEANQAGLGMFIDSDGRKNYQANPYAPGRVDSGYASKVVDKDIMDQAFNRKFETVETKDANGKVIKTEVIDRGLQFSNPDTAAFAQTLGITPGMSDDEIRSRMQGRQKDFLDIMGDSYQTNPVVQHYGAYNSPQHDTVKQWGMGNPGLGINYAAAPLLQTSNAPYLVPGSTIPFNQAAFTQLPAPPSPPINHGGNYDTTKVPSSTATPNAAPAASIYNNPYTDYLDKLMLKNSPQTSVPYAPAPVMPQMQQSPLPHVAQYQDPYGTMLPRINYNIPYKRTK